MPPIEVYKSGFRNNSILSFFASITSYAIRTTLRMHTAKVGLLELLNLYAAVNLTTLIPLASSEYETESSSNNLLSRHPIRSLAFNFQQKQPSLPNSLYLCGRYHDPPMIFCHQNNFSRSPCSHFFLVLMSIPLCSVHHPRLLVANLEL